MPTMNLLEQDRINRERLSKHDFDKNFLVSAGAGAGKTYLTVERAFNMLCDQQLGVRVSADQFVCQNPRLNGLTVTQIRPLGDSADDSEFYRHSPLSLSTAEKAVTH